MSFIRTKAITKLLRLKKRIKGVPGGTSAGKTFGILPILSDKAIKTPGLEISVVAESVPHLRRGALKDFEKIMRSTNRWIDDHFNKTFLKYTFYNGSYIEFFSADQPDRLRGARRNILYINECNNITFEAYQQLSIRTDREVWLDFNPTHEFWYHTEVREDIDCEEIVLTYKDNDALSESIVKEIEKALGKGFHDTEGDINDESNIKSKFWANWWKVYGLGMLGSLEGVIFNNWNQIKELPNDARLLGYGLDFGYTNDPTALIAVYKYNNSIILDELIYNTKLLNQDIVDLMNKSGVMPRSVIYADSAEPKSIEEIHRKGFNIKPVKKGADSINFGISILQEQNILITNNSVNLIKELRNYVWDTDKNGSKINKPIDKYNHAIDAVRYFAMMQLKQKRKKAFGSVRK